MIYTYHLIVQHHFEPSKVVPVKVLILKGQVGIHFLSFITKRMKFFCRIKQNACRGLQRHQISATCGPSSCWDLQWIFLVFMEKRKRIPRKGCTKINRRHNEARHDFGLTKEIFCINYNSWHNFISSITITNVHENLGDNLWLFQHEICQLSIYFLFGFQFDPFIWSKR